MQEDLEAEIEGLLEEWYRRVEAGEQPSLAELCRSHPELQPRLERLLEREAVVVGSLRAVGREVEGDEAAPVRRRLGDYEIIAPLGRGGMGEVFLARQDSLGRHVALKVLRPEISSSPARRLRFQREAEITAALDHPNIVPVYASGEDQGCVYIVMKLLHGAPLSELGKVDPETAASWGRDVALALHSAHEVGVVHRDVKPANVMLADGVPFVLDFGLAHSDADGPLTETGRTPGTLPYMAPEQLRAGGSTFDPRIDVYGLGATLYEALAGHPPFGRDVRPEVLVRRILFDDAPKLAMGGRHRDLETIVFRALEKDPGRRFPTAAAMAEDLVRYLERRPILSRPIGPVRRAGRVVLRNKVAASTIGVVLFLALILGGLFVRESRRTRELEQTEARERRAAMIQVQELVDAGRFLQAREHLAGISPGADLVPLQRLIASSLDLDALLDLLESSRRHRDLRQMRVLRDRLEAGDPRVRDGDRARIARCLLAHSFREGDGVARWLGDLRIQSTFPRTRAVLAAITANDPTGGLDAAPPAAAGQPRSIRADDHLFCALLLRIEERPWSEIEAELARALHQDEQHLRTWRSKAVVLAERGELEHAADVLGALPRDDLPQPQIYATLAWIHRERGEKEAFWKRIGQARRDLERAGRPPLYYVDLLEVEARYKWRDEDGFVRALAAARRLHGDQPGLLRLAAHAARRFDRDENRARRLFLEAKTAAWLPWDRRLADLALLQIDARAWLAGRAASDITPDELIRRARRLGEDATTHQYPRVAADAWFLVYAIASRARRGFAQKWTALERTLSARPRHTQARYARILEYRNRLDRILDGHEDDPEAIELTGPARSLLVDLSRAADALVEDIAATRAKLKPVAHAQLLIAAATLSLQLGDTQRVARYRQRAEGLLTDLDSPLAAQARRALAELDRRVKDSGAGRDHD